MKTKLPDSTAKRNTLGPEDLRWCFKSEAFPRTVIDPPLDSFKIGWRNLSKVGLLWEEASYDADRVLDGATLPAVIRLTEPGLGTKDTVSS